MHHNLLGEQRHLLPAFRHTSGSLEYLWKIVDSSCDNVGWNCIGIASAGGFTGPLATQIPPSSFPIYLIVNSETINTMSQSFTVNCSNLKSEEFKNYNNIELFPNPAKTFLNLQTKDNVKIDKFYLTDLSGKILLKQIQNTSQLNV